MSWECKKCGACCKSPFTKFWLPEFWDEDKKQCKYLTEDNLCSIYGNRPSICTDIDFKNVPRGLEFRKLWCEVIEEYVRLKGGKEC